MRNRAKFASVNYPLTYFELQFLTAFSGRVNAPLWLIYTSDFRGRFRTKLVHFQKL